MCFIILFKKNSLSLKLKIINKNNYLLINDMKILLMWRNDLKTMNFLLEGPYLITNKGQIFVLISETFVIKMPATFTETFSHRQYFR